MLLDVSKLVAVSAQGECSNRIEMSGAAAKELVHFNFLIKLSALNTFCLLCGASSGKALTRTHTHPAKLRNNNDNNTSRLANTECRMGDVDGAITSVLESSSSSAYGAHTTRHNSQFSPVCARCEKLEKKKKHWSQNQNHFVCCLYDIGWRGGAQHILLFSKTFFFVSLTPFSLDLFRFLCSV